MIDNLEKRLQEHYLDSKGNFKHKIGELIRIFPFITNSSNDSDERELQTYMGICGIVARRLVGVEKCPPFARSDLRKVLQNKVETEQLEDLLDILTTLAFDEQGSIVPFSLSAYPYLGFVKDRAVLKELGVFLHEVLFGFELDESLKNKFEEGSDSHVAHTLLHTCFPDLEPCRSVTIHEYTRLNIGLQDVFLQDWSYLSAQPERLKGLFPEFLQLYSLLYQLRAVETLSSQFDDKKLDPIFFTLEWESCSKARLAYQAGWNRLDAQVKRIFSHVNTLELLNHIEFSGLKDSFTYDDLRQWSEQADVSDKQQAEEALDHLILFYRDSIAPRGGWGEFEPFDSSRYSCSVLNKASILFQMVDCQFRNSHRNAPAGRYANWVVQSAANNFCRMRGRIGRTLAFNKEQLILLTRLAVGTQPKLRLHEYWEELERRGIAFDSESRAKIVELFEQLNLLEKKSDSGDAQYVRTII